MTTKQLKGRFGRSALDIVGAMFQHQSKIGEQARFQSKDEMIHIVTESGRKAVLRRSQIHPTVVHSAMKSALATSATGIASSDTFVQMGGGTPEGIVAAIMLGFQKVVYIAADEREFHWMSLPSKHEEQSMAIDYGNYTSPDADFPEKGYLAAQAVKMLSPYIRNYVFETTGTVHVSPPVTIEIPPLQTFTFVQVTGRVIARTILGGQRQPADSVQAKHVPVKKGTTYFPPADGGPGSSGGDMPPVTPKSKGKPVTPKKAKEGEENTEEAEEEEEEEAEEDDLAALEALEAKARRCEHRGATPNGGELSRGLP
jgi:hypothetical protein